MNLIPKIAEMLGVEIGEEFKLENHDDRSFKFAGTGLYEKTNIKDSYWSICSGLTLRDVLIGFLKIEKLPFEPKKGESYFYVGWGNGSEEISVYVTKFYDCDTCCHHKYSSNCFRTKAEAEREKYNVYERLTGKKWEHEQ
ncbi:hypothetical protein SAMN04487864_108160 [Succiniclasticum ruminis]|uniref:Uncharacterized protein n=1 Tax=Succiniclasticum ruminis TaxID=40841 RepID=A0A1G6M3Q8_9FIRM|nr:hypothetical protein [Succiniclasticum ruminis]SDC50139.1 hypothetical protein SAMN04487864_108160 [Succiniclasticum ruminis]